MGKWVHKLSKIDGDARTAVCANCGPVSIRVKDSRNNTWRCNDADRHDPRRRGSARERRHKGVKGTTCEKCGFVAEHPCQLDVDHKDGNKHNNDPSNWQTLCANCHRLKTWLNKDYQQ